MRSGPPAALPPERKRPLVVPDVSHDCEPRARHDRARLVPGDHLLARWRDQRLPLEVRPRPAAASCVSRSTLATANARQRAEPAPHGSPCLRYLSLPGMRAAAPTCPREVLRRRSLPPAAWGPSPRGPRLALPHSRRRTLPSPLRLRPTPAELSSCSFLRSPLPSAPAPCPARLSRPSSHRSSARLPLSRTPRSPQRNPHPRPRPPDFPAPLCLRLSLEPPQPN